MILRVLQSIAFIKTLLSLRQARFRLRLDGRLSLDARLLRDARFPLDARLTLDNMLLHALNELSI